MMAGSGHFWQSRVIGNIFALPTFTRQRKSTGRIAPLTESKEPNPDETESVPRDENPSRHRVPTPIKVFNAQTGEHIEIPFQKRVSTLLLKLGLDSETVLVIQKDSLLLPGDSIDPHFEVEIRPVISGGSGKGSVK